MFRSHSQQDKRLLLRGSWVGVQIIAGKVAQSAFHPAVRTGNALHGLTALVLLSSSAKGKPRASHASVEQLADGGRMTSGKDNQQA